MNVKRVSVFVHSENGEIKFKCRDGKECIKILITITVDSFWVLFCFSLYNCFVYSKFERKKGFMEFKTCQHLHDTHLITKSNLCSKRFTFDMFRIKIHELRQFISKTN